jgi:hypothetical protein
VIAGGAQIGKDRVHAHLEIGLAAGLTAATAAAALALSLGPAAPAARALNVDATCTGTVTTTNSPGITNPTQEMTVTANGSFAPCASLSDLRLTSGSFSASGTGPYSCLTRIGPARRDQPQ